MQQPRTEADHDPAAAWMQKLGALPSSPTPLPNADVLWWQAQAQRRLDEQRQRTTQLEVGERIQAACLILGALALLAWMLSQVPGLGQLPAYVLGGTLGTLLVAIAAVFTLWGERSGR
jgi:hypothetical protein